MVRNIVLVALLLLLPAGFCFPQAIDNVYGDYLIANVEKNISLDLEGANLLNVLKMLSRQTSLNFISTEAVQERVLTVYLENTPLKDAVDIIFAANGLTYDYFPDSNIFVIKEMGKPALELKTKIYYLQYARVGQSRLSTERDNSLSDNDSSTSNQEREGDQKQILGAVTRVLSDYGKVVEDSLTNSLVITDVPSQFPVIEEVITKLDVPLKQVMIEVEMLDVDKNLVDELGFRYGSQGSDWANFRPGSKVTGFPFPNRLSGSDVGSVNTGTLSLANFVTTMQFLTSDSTTKFLARPKILTLSNETAEVNLTIDEVIGVSNSYDDEGNLTAQEAERAETGTRLRVTPQINSATGEITLFIEVVNREAKDSGIDVNSADAMNVEERGTKCMIRLKDGETLLLSGLIKRDEDKTVTKVPILGDLPFLGRIFRYKDSDVRDREMLVFLTPRVIDNENLSSFGFGDLREQNNISKSRSVSDMLNKYTPRER